MNGSLKGLPPSGRRVDLLIGFMRDSPIAEVRECEREKEECAENEIKRGCVVVAW